MYPNCDGNAFDNHWNELIEKTKMLSAKNIVVSISTKFDISDNILKSLEEVNQLLQKNKGMLKISVSFSCEKSIGFYEENTATYSERLNLIKKLVERKIPYCTIIKPILPFIDFMEYKKIIDDTKGFCQYYVVGNLYIDINSEFYQKFIKNKDYLIKERSVSWNGKNGAWKMVVDDELKSKIKEYIIYLGGKVFESDKDAIMYMRR